MGRRPARAALPDRKIEVCQDIEDHPCPRDDPGVLSLEERCVPDDIQNPESGHGDHEARVTQHHHHLRQNGPQRFGLRGLRHGEVAEHEEGHSQGRSLHHAAGHENQSRMARGGADGIGEKGADERTHVDDHVVDGEAQRPVLVGGGRLDRPRDDRLHDGASEGDDHEGREHSRVGRDPAGEEVARGDDHQGDRHGLPEAVTIRQGADEDGQEVPHEEHGAVHGAGPEVPEPQVLRQIDDEVAEHAVGGQAVEELRDDGRPESPVELA